MRILYAIQGTGNGHLSRARDIIPILQQKGDLDILVSGIQADVELPYPIKYKCKGLSFIFGKKGGIDVMATYRKNNLKQLFKEVRKLPIDDYDLVINDFEPVSAWACKRKNIPCIGLSHQSAVINLKAPKPAKGDLIGKAVLQYYAPVSVSYGFHFEAYDKNIFTPVIRSEIRLAVPQQKGHYTVYLPAYNDERIIKVLGEIKHIQWQVFSKHSKKAYEAGNVQIQPIQNEKFIESFINCNGILCGAGFETPAEALYLRKQLLVIPMKGQYEQQCNAAALETLQVPVLKKLKKKHIPIIEKWAATSIPNFVDYPDNTERIIHILFNRHWEERDQQPAADKEKLESIKELQKRSLGKILDQIAE